MKEADPFTPQSPAGNETGTPTGNPPGIPPTSNPENPAEIQEKGVDPFLVVSMLLLSSLWGFNAITIKMLTNELSPLLAAGLRGAMALPCLLLYGAIKKEPMVFGGWRLFHGAVAGLIFTLEFCLFYTGARWTNGGHIAIFINTAPFYVAIGAHWLLRGDRLFLPRALGLGLAFAGIVALFSDDLYLQQSGFWRGDLLVMGGAMLWAVSTLYVKRFMVGLMSGFQMLYIQILVSTPLLLAAAVFLEPVGQATFSGVTLGILVFQGLVVVFFSYLAWMNLLTRYPASAVQSFTFLSPVWGVVLGVVLLAETVTGVMMAGITMVGAGLYLVNRPRPPSA